MIPRSSSLLLLVKPRGQIGQTSPTDSEGGKNVRLIVLPTETEFPWLLQFITFTKNPLREWTTIYCWIRFGDLIILQSARPSPILVKGAPPRRNDLEKSVGQMPADQHAAQSTHRVKKSPSGNMCPAGESLRSPGRSTLRTLYALHLFPTAASLFWPVGTEPMMGPAQCRSRQIYAPKHTGEMLLTLLF